MIKNNKKNKKTLGDYLLARMVARWGVLTASGGAGEAEWLPGKMNGELG